VSESSQRRLTIGAFARRSRLSLKALRLYERLGLLTPAEVDPANGYRWYLESQLFRARLIVGLRRLDMPLSDVVGVVGAPPETAAALVASYWDGVERHVASQRELAERLRTSMLDGEAQFEASDVRERDVPEQIVLSERRAVDLHGLPAMITGAIERLTRRADEHGGVAGELWVVFHGEVNEDSDGPVEVCVPVAICSRATRPDPAHREAYVTVRKAQFGWPQILSAYDVVERWMDSRSRACAGPPREVYRLGVHPASASPGDEICDVAFPIR
jgi:DNA-binding transcriptional MerR regulator